MNYNEFKIFLEGITQGDKNLPDDDILKPILLSHLREVALLCEPLSLMTRDLEHDVLLTLDSRLFIREPKLKEDDSSLIDIDKTLVYAVAYLVACEYSKSNKEFLYARSQTIINEYNWKRYRDLESEDFDLEKTLIENSLAIHGYKKVYIQKFKTIRGTVYIWDDEFIITLGKYLSGEVLELSKSDRTNIDEYLAYKQSESSDNDMYEQLDKYLWEK